MITKRDRNERGPTDAGWLKSKHTFSFGHYNDPDHMGFGPLRVINEDHVIPNGGFGTHPHSNMEIISYVLGGELAHKDNMGNGSSIRPGDIQLMSAGTGVTHSEFNGSEKEAVHFLQIWIMPDVQNTTPDYQQKRFDPADMRNNLRVVVAPNGEDGALVIKQDARVLATLMDEGAVIDYSANPARKYWVQIAQGIGEVNGLEARNGDGFAITGEEKITLKAQTESEILLFDLP